MIVDGSFLSAANNSCFWQMISKEKRYLEVNMSFSFEEYEFENEEKKVHGPFPYFK